MSEKDLFDFLQRLSADVEQFLDLCDLLDDLFFVFELVQREQFLRPFRGNQLRFRPRSHLGPGVVPDDPSGEPSFDGPITPVVEISSLDDRALVFSQSCPSRQPKYKQIVSKIAYMSLKITPHNLKVSGSIPFPATNSIRAEVRRELRLFFCREAARTPNSRLCLPSRMRGIRGGNCRS